MAFPTDYTLLGTLTAPSVTGSSANVPLLIKFEDFTTGMLASLDTGGGDLRLSSDAAGSNQLALEIVSFNKSSGGIQVWYKEPTAETGQIVYVWGDNTGDAKEGDTATYGRDAVWSDYGFVSHDGGATDSTGNHTPTLNGGIVGGDATGAIGVATEFNGSSDYIEVGNSADLNTAEGTMQAIVLINGLASDNNFYNIVNRQNASYGTELLGISSSSDKLQYKIRKSGGSNNDIESAITIGTGQFYWCYGTYNATTDEQKLYLDTATPVSGTITDAIDTSSPGAWTIGARGDATSMLNGVLDEVRRTGLVLSTNQILVEISNQSASNAWFTATNASTGISITEAVATLNITSVDPTPSLTGAISITEAVSTLNITSVDPVIDFTGTISITESAATLNTTSIDPVIDLTATLTITESVATLNLTSFDPTITLTAANTISITEAVATLNTATQSPIITLSGTLTVVESTSTVNMLTQDPSITLGLPTYSQIFTGIEKSTEFTGTIKSYGFTGTIVQSQTFSGTTKAASFLGVTQ